MLNKKKVLYTIFENKYKFNFFRTYTNGHRVYHESLRQEDMKTKDLYDNIYILKDNNFLNIDFYAINETFSYGCCGLNNKNIAFIYAKK